MLFVLRSIADDDPTLEEKAWDLLTEVRTKLGKDMDTIDNQWEAAAGKTEERIRAGKEVTTVATIVQMYDDMEQFIVGGWPADGLDEWEMDADPEGAETQSPGDDPAKTDETASHQYEERPGGQPKDQTPRGEAPGSDRESGAQGGTQEEAPKGSAGPKFYRRDESPLLVERMGDVTIPEEPRQWALGCVALYDEVTTIAAPGATGKTTFAVGLALEAASGLGFLGHKVWQGPQVTLHISSEEAGKELRRRYRAAALHHQIAQNHVDNLTWRGADTEPDKRIDLV
jgi:hypothetical protein